MTRADHRRVFERVRAFDFLRDLLTDEDALLTFQSRRTPFADGIIDVCLRARRVLVTAAIPLLRALVFTLLVALSKRLRFVRRL